MNELHTVSLYDDEEVAKQPTASPPTPETAPPAMTPNDPINRTIRNAIVSLSATYIAIMAVFFSWLGLSDFADGLTAMIAVAFWGFVSSIVELVLAVVCAVLTIAKWHILPRWVKGVGLFPLIVSIGLIVLYATATPSSAGSTNEQEPRQHPSCDPIDLCREVNATHFPLHYPKICYFPDSFPEQDCFNSTIDLSSALQGCNFTEICSTILGNETIDG